MMVTGPPLPSIVLRGATTAQSILLFFKFLKDTSSIMRKGLSLHRNALCPSLPSGLCFHDVKEIASNPMIFKSLNSSLNSIG